MVVNRNSVSAKFVSGADYEDLAPDAEPRYELGVHNRYGSKPSGETGIGWATAKTTGEVDHPVAGKGGRFYGKYAAIVPRGHGAMIVGIYRLRFRVANTKNAGVSDAWGRIAEGNREGLAVINAFRKSHGLKTVSAKDRSQESDEYDAPAGDSPEAADSQIIH